MGIHMDTHNRDNDGKIQAMGASNYVIVHQVALLGVSDHCVKKIKRTPCPHEYIYFKSPMDWIPYPALDS